jgi:hypothetical protein
MLEFNSNARRVLRLGSEPKTPSLKKVTFEAERDDCILLALKTAAGPWRERGERFAVVSSRVDPLMGKGENRKPLAMQDLTEKIPGLTVAHCLALGDMGIVDVDGLEVLDPDELTGALASAALPIRTWQEKRERAEAAKSPARFRLIAKLGIETEKKLHDADVLRWEDLAELDDEDINNLLKVGVLSRAGKPLQGLKAWIREHPPGSVELREWVVKYGEH